ncbi:MAG: oxidoreductase [Promethearchaeota archaeon]
MLNFKNHFLFAPIKTGYSDGSGVVTQAHMDFYEQRCKDLGAIILEPLYLSSNLREIPTQLGIDNDGKIPGLKNLIDMIHKYDTRVIAHLNHPGRMANPKIPNNVFYSSTSKPCENGGAKPKQISEEEMNLISDQFIAAAKRAEKAGFDVIELQFGHGYLFAQFISPKVNNRQDEYGGSFQNRIKFPLKIFKLVKETVQLPIIVRISGDEMIPDGIHIDEMIKLSKILQENGAAAIHVSAGTVCSTPPWFFQHMFIPKGKTWELADKIKKEIDIPVIFVGRIDSIEDVNILTEKYHADFLAIGRGLIADLQIVSKLQGKNKSPIIPCLACVEGCLGGVKSGSGLQCLVNPGVQKNAIKPIQAKNVKHFAVIGGGLAGMEAALVLSERGHLVDLFEKNKLGGQFRYAPLTPYKQSLQKLIPSYLERIANSKIPVIYKEITKAEEISKYDGVIIATGSVPKIPEIPNLTDYSWAEILLPENLPSNQSILIIGGGLIGVDIATALVEKKNKVIIVKRTEDFGGNMEMIAKKLSLNIMKKNNVVFSDHTYIKNIKKQSEKYFVEAERDGKQINFENIDKIVISTGLKSYNPFKNIDMGKIPMYVIGDAAKVGDAQNAIFSAYKLAVSM